MVITPLLHKPDGTVPLEDLVIRGGRFSLLQERDYWQYETYVRRFRPDTLGREAAFQRFVKFPYPEDARLDSLVESRSTITYYYSQEVPTDETSKKMFITLTGKVQAVDDSAYRLPPSDTLAYLVSSMLSFVDTLPRYRIRVIDKYVTVEDRNYIRFFVGDTRVVDTLGDNGRELEKISGLMRRIIEQEEFYVDTITLTASSSPEGRYAFNERLSRGRAEALKRYLVRHYGPGHRHAADRAVGRRGVARADEPHPHGPCADEPRGDAGAPLRGAKSGPAGTAAARTLSPGVCLPEGDDLPTAPLCGLSL